MVDLAAAPFWVAVLAAYLLLAPTSDGTARARALWLVHFGFLVALLGPGAALGVGCFVLAYRWLLLGLESAQKTGPANPQADSDSTSEGVAVWLLLIGGLAAFLFLLAKRPELARFLTIGSVSVVLAGIGFSYILLRGIYLTRAVVEGRYSVPSLIELWNYLLPFHMLAAGPIQTYRDFQTSDLGPPKSSDLLVGLERISSGLFKKFVLADGLRLLFLTDFTHPEPAYLLFEIQVSYLWLFLDFSGYSDIAIGVGRLFGMRVPENFRYPLAARNLIDFWQRWHITLGDFIKTEIYLPLQFWLLRNRIPERPLLAAMLSFTAAFVLCGLWHGLNVRFALWGLLHGFGLGVCYLYQQRQLARLGRKGRREQLKNPVMKALSVLITFEFIALTWFVAIAPETLLWPRG